MPEYVLLYPVTAQVMVLAVTATATVATGATITRMPASCVAGVAASMALFNLPKKTLLIS